MPNSGHPVRPIRLVHVDADGTVVDITIEPVGRTITLTQVSGKGRPWAGESARGGVIVGWDCIADLAERLRGMGGGPATQGI